MTRTSLLLLATLLAAGTLQAQTQPQAPGGRMTPEEHARAKACQTEMKQLCAGKTGQDAKSCLQTNESKLSPQCKAQVPKSGS